MPQAEDYYIIELKKNFLELGSHCHICAIITNEVMAGRESCA